MSDVKIALTGGVFDILHPGHCDYLHWMRDTYRDHIVVVAMNTDKSLATMGRHHLHSFEERMWVVSSLKWVDSVLPMDETDPRGIIASLQPNVFVKCGKEYEKWYNERDTKKIPEILILEELGIPMEFAPTYHPHCSSTMCRDYLGAIKEISRD